ncbi:hypothetical protein [Sulfurimonas sp.]|jgi:hypothetical protein|uniref:hypothetical protein n=1 Tax=Sulfurimonas sp. TaxID=2022749 RepID=UPI0025DB047D|nr:hypothetical protein [Sulfurimonas sp.]MBT5934368.1 hypothetical protein [Sulfurimonas sp.]
MYKMIGIAFLILFTGCGSDDTKSDTSNDSKDNNFTIIRGTVPGTLIEAICDSNKYFSTNSINNTTNRHPFALEIESSLNCKLVMTTNEGTNDNIITNIEFNENNATNNTFKALVKTINLGNIALALDKSSIIDDNNDSIVDTPITLSVIQHIDVLDVDDSGSLEQNSYEEYNTSKNYAYADRVTFNNENFEAKEITLGNEPNYDQNGKWIPLSFSSDASTYEEHDITKNYAYPNRVKYFSVVYQAKHQIDANNINPEAFPYDLNTSFWQRLGDL